MNKVTKVLFKVLDVILIFTMTFGSPMSALADPSPTGATVVTDLPDYPPGATVLMTGAGWFANEGVHIVVNADDQSWTLESNPDPIADGSGGFTYEFTLPNWFVPSYTVTATGFASGTATVTFTDLSIGTYDQCANDDNSVPPGTGYPLSDNDPGCHWIEGNLQSNTAYYAEGDATVQRLWLTDFAPGSSHSVTIKYGTTKGGKHAYDFLTTWDWSEDWITVNDRCQGVKPNTPLIPGCTTAPETSLDIPVDPNAAGFDVAAGSRQFKMRGGTMNSATVPQTSDDYNGDSETIITVNFTVANSGDMCSGSGNNATCGVILWFGAHVSLGSQWTLYNGTTGAGSISGSPYHVALDKVDGASVGQRDNQMQSAVVTQIPNGHITIIKNAVPDDAQDFDFNVNNGVGGTVDLNFKLDDDSNATLPNSQTVDVAPGTYYAKELMPLPAGWTLTNLVCVDPSSNTTVDLANGTATINLASNETVTCTFTDTKAGQIIVEKVTVGGDASFEFDPSWGNNFFLSNGQSKNSGPLAAGTYSVAELTPPSTWNLTSATCSDGSSVGSISLQEGETVTCTFTNTRVYNQNLTVTKTADESFSRTYTWGIYKGVDKPTANISDGSSATFNYTVGVTHDNGTDRNFVVSGEITVSNPNGFDIAGMTISDAIEDGGTCSVTDGTNVTVPANGSVTRAYSCTFASNPGSGTNTATATWDATAYNTPNGSASGAASYDFAGVTPSIVNGSVTVTDPNAPNPPLPAVVSYTDPSPKEFTYPKSYTGVGGTCTDYNNTASLSTGSQASASVKVCVGKDLTISKIASASRTRTYHWTIDKDVDETLIEIAEDGTATFNYDVTVKPFGYTDSAHALGGTITIVNPNDWQDVTLTSLSDTLDQGGTCTITESAPYVVLKGKSLTVHYTCTTDGSSTQNNVAATWDSAAYFTPSGSVSGSAPVSFDTKEVYKTITVVDDKTNPNNPMTLGTWNWDSGAHTFEYSLDKEGVPGTCTDYTNTAVIDETDQEDSVKVTVCVAKDLEVEKTANPFFTRTFTWNIDKNVDQTTVNIADGGTATFNYTVDVFHNAGVDSAWTVKGIISITNPNNFGSIMANVSDAVDNGGTCALDNPLQATVNVAANTTVDVPYTCTFSDGDSGTNTATATWNNGADSATGSAGFAFATPTTLIDESVSVNDPLDPNKPRTFSYTDTSPSSFGYSFTTNGVAGKCTDYDNTATFATNDSNKTGSDKVIVTVCVGSNLTVTKTAVPTFTRTWDWTIVKESDATYNLFAGANVTHTYIVTVTPTSTDSAWKVVGVITVSNPNAWDVVANVGDVTNVGGVCAVDNEEVTVPANDSIDVGYTCTWASAPSLYNGTNTATVTWDKNQYFTPGDTASFDKDFEFKNPSEVNPTITVDDDNLTDEDWSASYEAESWPYTQKFSCPTTPSSYTNGVFSFTHTNTATINETDEDDDATVTVNCYAPVVSKTATGTYDERHEWTISKSVNPTSQSAFAGDTVSYEWTVTVTEQTFNEKFKVGGAITVVNPAPMEMIVDLSDTLGGGAVGNITASETCDYANGELTIPKESTAFCDYEANPNNKDDDTNNVTATLNGIKFTAFKKFGWLPKVIRGTVSLDDDQNPNLPSSISDGGTWKYKEDYMCSTDKSLYEGDNTYSFPENNTATLTFGVGDPKSANASTTVNCYVPIISKTANGTYDEVHDWEVFKSVSPASQNAFAGQKVNFNWTVRVDETTHGENYVVNGKITVINPNLEDALNIALSDALSNGSVATITGCTGGTWSSPNLIVSAGGTAVCDYTVSTVLGNMAAFNAALPASVGMQKIDFPEPGDPAYFEAVYVTGGGTLTGTYQGWSLDVDITMTSEDVQGRTANVYSSYALPAGNLGIENPGNLDLVNWIINQGFVGASAGGGLGNYTYGDVQRAIWELVDNTADTDKLNNWSPARVTLIKNAAFANGEGFIPECDDYVAVILEPLVSEGGTPQRREVLTLAQVSYASIGVSCATSNSVTATLNGVEYSASATINWTITKFNESANLDDDQNQAFPLTVWDDGVFIYNDSYTCSTSPASYTNGFYQYNETNKANLTFQTGSDEATASTAVKCYAPIVTKTAVGAYDERHEWAVTKSVTPATQDILAGDSADFDWTVTVIESVFEETFAVTGQIFITNPHPSAGMVVTLTDVLNVPSPVTITGCTNATLANGKWTITKASTAVCDYTVSPTGRTASLNTATVTNYVSNQPKMTVTASDPIEWTPNVIRGTATLDDDQANPNPWPPILTDGGSWTYNDSYACSTNQGDYTNGSYTHPETNTATVTSGGESDSSTANTQVVCHAPVVTKDATTYFNRDWDWSITKDFDATYNLFAGGSVEHDYIVTVTPTKTDNFWGVMGNITIANSHPTQDMVLTDVSDLAGGINGVVTCPLVEGLIVVTAAGSLTCTYDTGTQNKPNVNPFGDTNTATAVFASANWTGNADIVFDADPTTENEPVITVDDDNLTGEEWKADRIEKTWEYTREFSCPTTATYVNGKYSYSHTNTATMNISGNDDATVNVNCYAPVVTKTAATYFNRDWDWTIEKLFDGSYNLFAGDTVTHNYKVTVDPTYIDNFWGVTGNITVYNNHPTADMTLTSLTDNAGGINGNVTCSSLVVPANSSLVCAYDTGAQASPNINPFGNINTATAAFGGSDWTGTAPIAFSPEPSTEDDEIITVDDDNLTGESWSADHAGNSWPYTKDFSCPTDASLYTDGKYSYEHVNTATINETGENDKATVDINCYWPQIELTKTGNELSKIGDKVNYTITLNNNTPVSAGLRDLSCAVTDSMIGVNQTFTIASGGIKTIEVKDFIIPSNALDPFVNTASVTCKPVAATAPVVGDSTFSVDDKDDHSINLFQPAVEIVKTGPAYAYYGQDVKYTFTINNLSSDDSPNLNLASISDTILGDLMDETPVDCDSLSAVDDQETADDETSCTFTVEYEVPDQGYYPTPITNVVSVLYHPAGFPNNITDTDDHTVKVVPPSQATNSSLCIYDRDPNREGQQFRSLLNQDPQAWPSYRMNATNPGQFFYNVFATGKPGETLTFNITLPYPFVTQGANPVHAYDGVTTQVINGETCFLPGTSFFTGSQQVTLADYNGTYENQVGGADGNGGDSVGTYSFEVKVTVPASGFVYVNVHLDYGLKGTAGYINNGFGDAMSLDGLTVRIPQLADHTFLVSGAQNDGSTVENWNEFKKNPGVGGFSRLVDINGNPIVNAKIVLKKGSTIVGTAYTDEDGWYQIVYKHTGKAAEFTVTISNVPGKGTFAQTKKLTLKANAYFQVDFFIP